MRIDTRCIALGVVLFVGGFGLGFAVNSIFYPSGTMGTQLYIGEIEWSLEGDSLTMHIPIDNVGGFPVTIQSISVRENVTGSTEYTDSNPTGIFMEQGISLQGEARPLNGTRHEVQHHLISCC